MARRLKMSAMCFAVALLTIFLLAGCTGANAHLVRKLGVIAPFEGEGRSLGYAVLPVIKELVGAANARGDFGDYRLTVVAFNDDLDRATAARQAQALALDPDVVAVITVEAADTVRAADTTGAGGVQAAAILSAAGIPFRVIESAAPRGLDRAGVVADAKAATSALLQALVAMLGDQGRPGRAGPPPAQ